MEVKEQIKKWLNSNRDLYKGMQILSLVDPTQAEKLSQTVIQPTMLFKLLMTHYRAIPNSTTTSSNTNKQPQRVLETAIPKLLDLTQSVAIQAQKEASLLYKEMMNYRAQLFALCEDKESRFENEGQILQQRGLLAQKIMDLQYKVDEAYDKVHFAEKNGRLPSPEVSIIDTSDLYKQIYNARKYISKMTLKGDLSPAQSERLDARKIELEQLLKLYQP